MGWRFVPVCAVLLASTALVTGCTPPSGGGASPSTPDWFVGDSIAGNVGNSILPKPYVVAVGGAGFTTLAPTTILDNTEAQISQHGPPARMFVMGGVNDTNRGLSGADIVAGMSSFEAQMVGRDIRVVWVVEPAWDRAVEMDPVNEWVADQPEAIDCRPVAGPSIDGVHPADYGPLVACIADAIAAQSVSSGQ